MSTIEAMAAGLPILGNKHPGSPIEHGISGFLSDDPDQLRKYAITLLEDRQLAARMGQQAQKVIIGRFSNAEFKRRFLQSIETGRQKWKTRTVKV